MTVDRGALGPTIIGKGTKIDNLVQIAHNVVIGEHCLRGIASRASRAARSLATRRARRAGRVGRTFEDRQQRHDCRATGRNDTNIRTAKVARNPAQPDRQAKRQMIAVQQLPELLRRVAAIEKKLGLSGSAGPKSSSEHPLSWRGRVRCLQRATDAAGLRPPYGGPNIDRLALASRAFQRDGLNEVSRIRLELIQRHLRQWTQRLTGERLFQVGRLSQTDHRARQIRIAQHIAQCSLRRVPYASPRTWRIRRAHGAPGRLHQHRE